MNAAKVTLLIIDTDNLGQDEIKSVIENQKYPNYCIAPEVKSVEMKDIGDWHDEHALNNTSTSQAEYDKLFSPELSALPAIIEQAKAEEADRIGKLIHYPECWDTAAYPTLEDALAEIHFCSQCYDTRAAAIRARKP